ncbi:hypothetical protein PCANC_14982 [Puccinia coronata f. sp. avenae]|nr:hypothetical protein PCANC_14982 [Puccinia coronata f. sp. avenae]
MRAETHLDADPLESGSAAPKEGLKLDIDAPQQASANATVNGNQHTSERRRAMGIATPKHPPAASSSLETGSPVWQYLCPALRVK